MLTYNTERLKAISIIEALRSGVPTRVTTSELPDLRPDLTESIKSDLENFSKDNIPTGRLVWGKYGQGKSYLLTMLEHIALDMNYAVSYITLSREVSCQNLFSFYQHAAPIIRIPDSKVPGIYNKLSERNIDDLIETPIQTEDRYSHQLPAIVVECMLRSNMVDDFDYLYNDLMGNRMRIAEIRKVAKMAGIGDLMVGLPKFTQHYSYAYFGALSDVVRFCGFRGWVILIDEVELISRLGRVSRLKAYQNLDWLLNVSGNIKYPIYTIGAAATSLRDYWSSVFKHDDRTVISDLAKERAGEDEMIRMNKFFEWAMGDHCLKIEQVDRHRREELLQKVCRQHGIAYEWQSPAFELIKQSLGNLVADDPVRTHIRATIEALDNLLITGNVSEIRTEELIENPIKEDA